mmetsp:Transcript_19692/g.33784  ORF Transcript_19692/g.33784 Transcript_19692/m.33784 type:complete len:315 (+) Transcript_19692:1761-2705(+)
MRPRPCPSATPLSPNKTSPVLSSSTSLRNSRAWKLMTSLPFLNLSSSSSTVIGITTSFFPKCQTQDESCRITFVSSTYTRPSSPAPTPDATPPSFPCADAARSGLPWVRGRFVLVLVPRLRVVVPHSCTVLSTAAISSTTTDDPACLVCPFPLAERDGDKSSELDNASPTSSSAFDRSFDLFFVRLAAAGTYVICRSPNVPASSPDPLNEVAKECCGNNLSLRGENAVWTLSSLPGPKRRLRVRRMGPAKNCRKFEELKDALLGTCMGVFTLDLNCRKTAWEKRGRSPFVCRRTLCRPRMERFPWVLAEMEEKS